MKYIFVLLLMWASFAYAHEPGEITHTHDTHPTSGGHDPDDKYLTGEHPTPIVQKVTHAHRKDGTKLSEHTGVTVLLKTESHRHPYNDGNGSIRHRHILERDGVAEVPTHVTGNGLAYTNNMAQIHTDAEKYEIYVGHSHGGTRKLYPKHTHTIVKHIHPDDEPVQHPVCHGDGKPHTHEVDFAKQAHGVDHSDLEIIDFFTVMHVHPVCKVTPPAQKPPNTEPPGEEPPGDDPPNTEPPVKKPPRDEPPPPEIPPKKPPGDDPPGDDPPPPVIPPKVVPPPPKKPPGGDPPAPFYPPWLPPKKPPVEPPSEPPVIPPPPEEPPKKPPIVGPTPPVTEVQDDTLATPYKPCVLKSKVVEGIQVVEYMVDFPYRRYGVNGELSSEKIYPQWIEVLNTTNEAINLKGAVLKYTQGDRLTGEAEIEEDFEIYANSIGIIATLPPGYFSVRYNEDGIKVVKIEIKPNINGATYYYLSDAYDQDISLRDEWVLEFNGEEVFKSSDKEGAIRHFLETCRYPSQKYEGDLLHYGFERTPVGFPIPDPTPGYYETPAPAAPSLRRTMTTTWAELKKK